jgi:hypothetical protein
MRHIEACLDHLQGSGGRGTAAFPGGYRGYWGIGHRKIIERAWLVGNQASRIQASNHAKTGQELHSMASGLFLLAALSPHRMLAYAAAGVIAFSLVCYLLCLLPIHAWFRKSINSKAECPYCGSRDFRISHSESTLDRFRKKLGLQPFRCRGCMRRFISRSAGLVHSGVADLNRL